MMETLLIAAVLYTGWRVLRWVGRAVRAVFKILGFTIEAAANALVCPSQASRDRMAVEQLLKEVGAAR